MSYLPELRSSLVRAAERRSRRSADAVPIRTRFRFSAPLRALPTMLAVVVAVGIAGIALLVLGRGHPPSRSLSAPNLPNPGPAPSLQFIPGNREMKLIHAAQRKVVARDPACSPSLGGLPAVSQGSPSHELLSLLGVLRRPAVADDSQARSVFAPTPGGGAPPQEIYMRYSRLARVYLGASIYIVPAGNVTGFRAVPVRCVGEEAAALRGALRHARPAFRRGALDLQAQYLVWQRYQGLHAEGLLIGTASPPANGITGFSTGSGYPLVEFERQGINNGGAQSSRGQRFYGVVPDGVAFVTMRFSPYKGERFPAVTSNVVGNVWALVPPRGAFFPSAWIWRAAAGRVIRFIPGPGV